MSSSQAVAAAGGASAAAAPRPRFRSLTRRQRRRREALVAYSFIAPNFIGFAVFTLGPVLFAFALAFMHWDGSHAIEFVEGVASSGLKG